jgi:hypothetical protein
MRKVDIIGVGMTSFGKHVEKTFVEIITSGRAGGLANREPLEAVGTPWVT